MKINNLTPQIVPPHSADSSQQTTPASEPSLAPDKDTIEASTSTEQFQQIITDASANQAQSVQFSDDEGEVITPSLTPEQQNLQQQIGIARQLALMGVENPTQEQIDAGVKIANDPEAQKLLQQQLGVARQLALMGVENPSQEQIDAGVKIANDPAAQKQLQQELGVARQLELLGVENITKEQIDAGVKILNDPEAMKQLQQDIEDAREQVLQGKTPDSISPLLDSVLNAPGDTPSVTGSSILDQVLNTKGNTPAQNALDDVINTQGTTPWNGLDSVMNSSGSTSSGSNTQAGGTPSTSNPGIGSGDQPSYIDFGDSGKQGDPVASGGSEPASDPSEWLPFPGSSSGDSSSSAVGINGVDVRDDGSVQILLSDGTSQEFSNVNDAMDWEKQQGIGAAQQDSGGTSDPGGTSGGEEDTHTTIEGTTTVEVEAPSDDDQQTQTENTDDNTSEYIDPDGVIYDSGQLTEQGALKVAGGGFTDGVSPELQSEDGPPALTIHEQDGGVIDPTPEGSEGMATDVVWTSPYNIATPETRPELEPDAPDAPNQPGIDPYANKG